MKCEHVRDQWHYNIMPYWNKETYKLFNRIQTGESKETLKKDFFRLIVKPSKKKTLCIGCKKLKLPKMDITDDEGVCSDCYQSRIPCCGPLDPLLHDNIQEIIDFLRDVENKSLPTCLDEDLELKKLVMTLSLLAALEANNRAKFWEFVRIRDALDEHSSDSEDDFRRKKGVPHPKEFLYRMGGSSSSVPKDFGLILGD